MQGLNYTRLNSISNSVTPYRGSLNRFPIGSRKQSNKYFLVGEENGSRIFNIVYGQNWRPVDITKDEYDELNKQGSSKIRAYNDGEKFHHYRYDVTPKIIGVVRPDNSFEFTADRYGQGDRGILSAFGHGWLLTDSRRGGMVWMGRINGNGERGVMPIYRGMRVHCETMRPIKPITVVGRKVDRKVGKTLLANYADFYAVTETMTKAMDYETFVKTTVEVLTEHMSLTSPESDTNNYMLHRHHTEYTLVADALIHTAPLDAAILYMIAWDVGSMRWNMRRYLDSNMTRYSANEDTPHTMFLNLKRKLNKEIYKQNEQVFKKVEYAAPEMYPPSEWGYTVMVDGMEVQQYE
jgi:hypothetical protein